MPERTAELVMVFYLLVLNSVVSFSLEMVLYRAQSHPEKNMAAHWTLDKCHDYCLYTYSWPCGDNEYRVLRTRASCICLKDLEKLVMQQNDSKYGKSRLEFPVGSFIFWP